MSHPRNITGYVIKEEKVDQLSINTLKNTFVLQVNHPFPGYYGQEMIDMSSPRSIIFITKDEQSWEHIIRLSNDVNNELNLNLNLSKVKIKLWNKSYNGIRAKGFNQYKEIEAVQRSLKNRGIQFSAQRSLDKPETGLIKLKKFFNVEEQESGIYISPHRQDMAYLKIPKQVNWETFRKHTNMVKNNISDNSFDVVCGAFYTKNKIEDVLRIYKPDIKMDLLKEIKAGYEYEIAKYS